MRPQKKICCLKGELILPSRKDVEVAAAQKRYSGFCHISISLCSPSRAREFRVSKFFAKLPFLEVLPRRVLSCRTCFARTACDPFFFSLTLTVLHSLFSLSLPSLHAQSLSQNIQTSDGVHSQHKQMNILQTITSNGGNLQVIQAQTVQKSSSRRAITSSYSSQFSSNFSNGIGHGSFSSGHPMNSDLLVRLINVPLLWL